MWLFFQIKDTTEGKKEMTKLRGTNLRLDKNICFWVRREQGFTHPEQVHNISPTMLTVILMPSF